MFVSMCSLILHHRQQQVSSGGTQFDTLPRLLTVTEVSLFFPGAALVPAAFEGGALLRSAAGMPCRVQ
jgi:hypothetical protein